MRRLIPFVLICLLLVGCGRKTNVKPITQNIEFDTRICYFNECFEAAVSIDSEGTMGFDITSPDDISGLILTVKNGEVTASFRGMDYNEKNPQLFGAVGKVNEIFNDIRQNGVVRRDEEKYSVEGRLSGIEYDLTVSTSGIPIELEYDEGDLEMNFFNVTIKE